KLAETFRRRFGGSTAACLTQRRKDAKRLRPSRREAAFLVRGGSRCRLRRKAVSSALPRLLCVFASLRETISAFETRHDPSGSTFVAGVARADAARLRCGAGRRVGVAGEKGGGAAVAESRGAVFPMADAWRAGGAPGRVADLAADGGAGGREDAGGGGGGGGARAGGSRLAGRRGGGAWKVRGPLCRRGRSRWRYCGGYGRRRGRWRRGACDGRTTRGRRGGGRGWRRPMAGPGSGGRSWTGCCSRSRRGRCSQGR